MYYYPIDKNDRYFLAPLLLGGLGGAAIVASSRPRPVYVNPNYNYPPPANYYPYGYNYYSSYSYNPYFR